MSAPADSNSLGADYFQRLADGAPVMIWMAGHDMGCFYFNRTWLEFVGRTLAQEAGNGWAEGVHPDDLERCVNHYVGCFQRKMPFAMSYRLRHHEGDYRWILDRGAPHFSAKGEFLGYFGGCSEQSDENLISRHSALGESLGRMRAFARSVADEHKEAPLELAVQRLVEDHEADRQAIEHAGNELKKLAQDMVAFSRIARGACVAGEALSRGR